MSREQLISSPISGYEPEMGDALRRLEDGRQRTLRLLNEVDDEHVDVPMNDNSIGTILHHLAQHEAEHGGEIGTILTTLKRGGR